MYTDEIFTSCVRSKGDLAGVFEYDGETGYFYLYETEQSHGSEIVDSIHIFTGASDFTDADVSVRWDVEEQKVGLFISDTLWAVFDGTRRFKYGGSYRAKTRPLLPQEATNGFGTVLR